MYVGNERTVMMSGQMRYGCTASMDFGASGYFFHE
jgi:hypothetical protein